jgi:hypothetical protein
MCSLEKSKTRTKQQVSRGEKISKNERMKAKTEKNTRELRQVSPAD